MKVLWLCNIVLSEVAHAFGFKPQPWGGWLEGAWEQLSKVEKIERAICVPIYKTENLRDGRIGDYLYFSFLFSENEQNVEEQINRFKLIIDEYKPDVIHIWGTEFLHSYSMIQAASKKDVLGKVVINLQGLLSFCMKQYKIGLPDRILNAKEDARNDVANTFSWFEKNSKYEMQCLQMTEHIVGRTMWDRVCIESINSLCDYYYCGEILRPQIYDSQKWNCIECNRHTIFLSQAGYPIKGLHMVMNAFALLKTQYEDLKVVISGPNIFEIDSVYANYLKEQISEYDLQDTICFIGPQPVESMIEQYLASNVFLSPSLIENSSNSICEAMNLGVPVVASNVGGTSSLIDDGVNGLLYPLEESDKCVDLISQIFDDYEFASKLSEQAIVKGGKLNNRKEIVDTMINIYGKIVEDNARIV